jgi:hypothetical protein
VPTSICGGTWASTSGPPHGDGCCESVNVESWKSGPRSDAFKSRFCTSASVTLDDEALDDEDDFEDDDELLDELLELLEELDDEEEDDDGLGLDVAATLFLLPSSRVNRNAAIAMINTATTPTMIHRALLVGALGGGTGGIAVVGGVVGGPAAAMGWVAGPWRSGCCSGGYHLPSDACHQPGPCD